MFLNCVFSQYLENFVFKYLKISLNDRSIFAGVTTDSFHKASLPACSRFVPAEAISRNIPLTLKGKAFI